MFPNKKGYKSDYVILDKESHENDLKDFSFTFIELPKFNKDVDHLKNMTDKWSYFFKHAEETSEQDLHKLVGHDQIIERAFDELNRFSWNDEELRTYDQAEKYEGAYRASMAQKFDEGMAEGEMKAILMIAKSLINQGFEINTICAATGLSREKIESLRHQK